jgi:hypothetical protein
VDLSGGDPTVIMYLPGLRAGYVGISLDKVSQQIYWSEPEEYGVLNYDGSGAGFGTLIIDASRHLPPFPIPPPNDFLNFGWPAIEIAADSRNQRLYCNNGQQIWRARLDGSSFITGNPDPRMNPVERLYGSLEPCRGLTLDLGTQMLYWLEGNKLMRLNADPSLAEFQIIQSVEQVLTLQGVNGRILDCSLITTTGTTIEQLTAAQNNRKKAQADAARAVQAAHDNAASTTQAAQKILDDAHSAAATKISNAQQSAAGTRQTEQANAQSKRDQAAALVNTANGNANAARSQANVQAQALIGRKQSEANGIRTGAQADLDSARQRLQNT